MPPTNNPTPPPKLPRHHRSWASMKARANTISGVSVLLATILLLGGAAGYVISRNFGSTPSSKTPATQSLSPSDLSKLQQGSGSLGSSGQTLSIGADSIFKGKVDVGGDLSITGKLNANGPVVLSQLNISGTTALTGLSVGSNLAVGGTTTLQKSLTVNDLVTINSNLSVSGAANVGALNASTIAVRTLTITGALLISHLQTQGVVPIGSGGTAIGSGGTVSISGNDAAGTININTGSNTPAGVLITVVFRAPYSAQTHVLLSPISGAAASTPVYVTRNSTGFTVHTDVPPPAGANLSFDYFVTQ
jgi:uncharacterized protein (UPF0333 family)